ncbi:hypothetical protein N7478_010707 [Penicillium angulare]|uniref:uncharacterized protein n=1 Tax=Penicillium angulare TaxID=116970 RepID=UPI0025420729|nr:uncharacterized protein N7478_010707 [Penicillium angulare]KAJ5267899.1 hypothetical protein N7478_010707 [Penicillium angulare]
MKVTNIALAGAAIGLSNAGPVAKRAISDADILNYALTLEHLEASFYEEGLKNYTKEDFMNAGLNVTFYANLEEIASDEKSHETFLTGALSGKDTSTYNQKYNNNQIIPAAGASPVARCNYTFPSTDVKSFLALASVLEGVGVSAYLGAAGSIMNATYLGAAGSILTVEARHSAYLRAALAESPSPQAFDNPLDFNEVYTVASPFISSCPSSNGALPVKAFPSLTMSSTSAVMTGSTVQLMTGRGFNMSNTDDIYAAFITVTGPVWATLKSNRKGMFTVTIPKGIAGQSYVVLTKGNKAATDDNIVAGPAIVEVGLMMGGMGGSMTTSWPMTGTMMPTGSMGASATASTLPSQTPFNAAVSSGKGDLFGVLGAAFIAMAALF